MTTNGPIPRSRAVIGSVVGALCPPVAQSDVADLAVAMVPSLASSRYLSMFATAGITTRSLAMEPSWYASLPSLAQRSAVAVKVGSDLATTAATAALADAGVAPADVDAVVVASTTVVRSPGLDATLVATLGLRHDVRRVPVGSMASLGGAAALAVGADLVAAGHRCVLVVVVEVNSTAFTPTGDGAETVLTMALFSDGAAAAVLTAPDPAGGGDGGSVAVVGSASHLVPDSGWVMGFDVDDHGLRWRLAPQVPEVALAHTGASVDAALATVGWTRGDINHVLLHPGGLKVLAACAEALGLDDRALEVSRAVLADTGNVSGVTVLLVLERHLAGPAPAGRALLTAMGPGFGFEHVMLEVG